MSKKLFLLPALLLGAFLMFTPACGDSDACKDVDCGTNGACFDGDCVCDDGFEIGTGGLCDTEWSAKFIGSYTGTDGCGGALTTPVGITRVSESKIRITNFGGFLSYVDADVEGSDISITNYTDPANRKFTGSGEINGNTIIITYTVTYDDNTTETCTMTIAK